VGVIWDADILTPAEGKIFSAMGLMERHPGRVRSEKGILSHHFFIINHNGGNVYWFFGVGVENPENLWYRGSIWMPKRRADFISGWGS